MFFNINILLDKNNSRNFEINWIKLKHIVYFGKIYE